MVASSSIVTRLSTVALLLFPLAGGCLHVGRPPVRASGGVCGATVVSLVPWARGEAILGDAFRRACAGNKDGPVSTARVSVVAAGWDDATSTGTIPTREVVLRAVVARPGAADVTVEARRRLALGARAGDADALVQATLVQLADEVAVRAVRVRDEARTKP